MDKAEIRIKIIYLSGDFKHSLIIEISPHNERYELSEEVPHYREDEKITFDINVTSLFYV